MDSGDPHTVDELGEGGSVRAGSAARLVGNVAFAGISLLTGAAIARRLGPEGKGIASTMSYLVALGSAVAAGGLGEAAVVLVQSHRAALPTAVRTTTTVVLILGAITGLAMLGVAALLFTSVAEDLSTPLLALAASVPMATAVHVGCLVLDSRGRLIYSSTVRVVTAAVTLVATVALVQRWWLSGAVVAMAIGWAVGTAMVAVGLRRESVTPSPGFDRSYLRAAAAFGRHVQLAQLLLVLSMRADILVLQALRGADEVGIYSVAITMATLAAFPAMAISAATYPRIASLGEPAEYTARVVRLSVAAAVLAAGVLLPVIPIATPLAFGRGFSSAVAPALALLPGMILYSLQIAVARGRSAQGEPRLLASTLAVSVTTMVALDLALIPSLGTVGAVIASVVSSAAGAAFAVRRYRRAWGSDGAGRLFPSLGEAGEILRVPLDLQRNVRR